MKIDKNINLKELGQGGGGSWTFDGISESFDSHVQKSVPFYNEGHDLICRYSDFFLNGPSIIYDIGSSTGILLRKLLNFNLNKSKIEVVGIEPVLDMVNYSLKKNSDPRGSFICDEIINVELKPAALIISYYTIQFINPNIRQKVLDKIYQSLNWGGAFIIFEKVRSPDARFQDYSNQVYSDYKLQQGFTEKEIINKSRSLKGVLEPFSEKGNIDMLKRAGFVDICCIFKWVNFAGFLAIK
jgi:tRNA (cmo5U34)-methyltransferase